MESLYKSEDPLPLSTETMTKLFFKMAPHTSVISPCSCTNCPAVVVNGRKEARTKTNLKPTVCDIAQEWEPSGTVWNAALLVGTNVTGTLASFFLVAAVAATAAAQIWFILLIATNMGRPWSKFHTFLQTVLDCFQ